MLCSIMKKINLHYIIFISVLVLSYIAMPHSVLAQSKAKKYVGSSQFFDIAGDWVNNGDTATRRITRMNVSATIVNTYRIKPYFKLGKKDLPAPSTPIQVSEVELCYTGVIADAKCFIIPTVSNNKQYLKVYSVIIDPAGRWTGMGIDLLERKTADSNPLDKNKGKEEGSNNSSEKTNLLTLTNAPKSDKPDTLINGGNNAALFADAENSAKLAKTNANNTPTYQFSPKDLLGHWKNEWQYEQIITRLQVVDIEGRKHFKVYRLINDRERLLGTFPIIQTDKNDHSQIIQFKEGEVLSTFRFRPIIADNELKGIDLIIEEFYAEGSPKGIFRQFFVPNPLGAKISAAEELIKQIDGEWENVDAFSPTPRIDIRDGEIEVWGKSDKSTTILGKKTLSYSEGNNDFVGTTLPGAAFRRKVEIDAGLAINDYLKKDTPHILIMTSYIEDVEGVRPNRTMTEVFRKKGAKIPAEAFGINEKKTNK
jgi:hypothetical protein